APEASALSTELQARSFSEVATRYHSGEKPVQERAGEVRVASESADWDSIGKKSVGVISRCEETEATFGGYVHGGTRAANAAQVGRN
ncbi:MAG: hypothetical protein ACREIH_08625, partial [Nitrospiraceae bacterium]